MKDLIWEKNRKPRVQRDRKTEIMKLTPQSDSVNTELQPCPTYAEFTLCCILGYPAPSSSLIHKVFHCCQIRFLCVTRCKLQTSDMVTAMPAVPLRSKHSLRSANRNSICMRTWEGAPPHICSAQS